GGGGGLVLGLDDFETFELGMAEIKAATGLVVGAGMRAAKLFRTGPRLERGLVDPRRMGRIQRVVVRGGPLQEMKLDEAGHAAEKGFPRCPQHLEGLLGPLLHLEPVHRDKHSKSPRLVAWKGRRATAALEHQRSLQLGSMHQRLELRSA